MAVEVVNDDAPGRIQLLSHDNKISKTTIPLNETSRSVDENCNVCQLAKFVLKVIFSKRNCTGAKGFLEPPDNIIRNMKSSVDSVLGRTYFCAEEDQETGKRGSISGKSQKENSINIPNTLFRQDGTLSWENKCKLCQVTTEVAKIYQSSIDMKLHIKRRHKNTKKSSITFKLSGVKKILNLITEEYNKSKYVGNKIYLIAKNVKRLLHEANKDFLSHIIEAKIAKVNKEIKNVTKFVNNISTISREIEKDISEADTEVHKLDRKCEISFFGSANLHGSVPINYNSDSRVTSIVDSEGLNNLLTPEHDKLAINKYETLDEDGKSEFPEVRQEEISNNNKKYVSLDCIEAGFNKNKKELSISDPSNVVWCECIEEEAGRRHLYERVDRLEEEVWRMAESMRSEQLLVPENHGTSLGMVPFTVLDRQGYEDRRDARQVQVKEYMAQLRYLERECRSELAYLHRNKEDIDYLAGMTFLWGPMIYR